ESHGRIDVAARDGPDGIAHGQQGQAKGQGHAGKAYAQFRVGRGKDRAAAAAKNQPESPKKFRTATFRQSHGRLPSSVQRRTNSRQARLRLSMEQSSIIDKPVANGRISPDSKQMRRKTLSPLLFLGPEKARKKNKTRIEAGF